MNIRLQGHKESKIELEIEADQHPGPYIMWENRLFVMSRDDQTLFLERGYTVLLNRKSPTETIDDAAQKYQAQRSG